MVDMDPRNVRHFSEDLVKVLTSGINLETIDLDGLSFAPGYSNCPLPIGLPHEKSLQKLRLLNTMEFCSPNSLFYLVNLTELTITPRFLHYTLIKYLAQRSLRRLNLVNKPKVHGQLEEFTPEMWESITEGTQLSVGVYTIKVSTRSSQWDDHVLTPGMPVSFLVYNKRSWIPYTLIPTLKSYAGTLRELVDFSLTSTGNKEKATNLAVSFIRQFPHIHTLALRMSLSSATLLAMVMLNPNLRHLPVREDMVTFVCDLQLHKLPELSADDCRFIRENYGDRQALETAMSSLLGSSWSLMTPGDYGSWMRDRYRPYFGEFMI